MEKKLYFSTGYENSDYLNTLDGEVISKSERNVVENESGETSAIIGNYRYYSVKTSGSVTKLYRENTKTGKKQLVAEFKSGIWNWRVCDDYVMIECLTGSYQKNNLKANVYCVSANGKKKKKLASWTPAE